MTVRSEIIRVKLDDAHVNTKQYFPAAGHSIHVLSTSSDSALVSVTVYGINRQEFGALPMQERDNMQVPVLFTKIGVNHTAQAGEWVDLLVVTMDEPPAEFEFNRAGRSVVDSISNPVTVQISEGTATTHTPVTVDNTAAVQLLAADPDRISALVYLPRDFTGKLYTGAADTVDNTAAYLEGGTFYEHKTTDALWGITDAGSVDVSVRESK